MLWLHLSDTRLMKCTLDTGLKYLVTYIQCSKAIYHQLSGDTPKGWAAVDNWRKRPTETTLKTNKTKQINKPTIKSCPWGGTTPGTSTGCNQPAVNQLCRKGPGVLKDKMNLETVPAAKASSTRSCVRQSITCRLRVEMLFCCPILECCVLCWVPQHRNMDAQE